MFKNVKQTNVQNNKEEFEMKTKEELKQIWMQESDQDFIDMIFDKKEIDIQFCRMFHADNDNKETPKTIDELKNHFSKIIQNIIENRISSENIDKYKFNLFLHTFFESSHLTLVIYEKKSLDQFIDCYNDEMKANEEDEDYKEFIRLKRKFERDE